MAELEARIRLNEITNLMKIQKQS